MGITQMKIATTVAAFLVIFVSGIWLSKTGQPFHAGVLAAHKLVSVAALVFLAIAVLNLNKLAPLGKTGLIACFVTGLLFVGAVATGGVLSAAKELPVVVQTLHKMLSVLTLLSTAVVFYLLYRKK